MYLIGYDIGSSSIKAALVNIKSGKAIHIVKSPSRELKMITEQTGWAEQKPSVWWSHVCRATKQILKKSGVSPKKIKGVGISYQMHGLVLVDDKKEVLRPSIIWCDSRATGIGSKAFTSIGKSKCLRQILNSPGNFTASKLKWVKDKERRLFSKVKHMMLPGDYIGMKLTGRALTTISGLSEGMLWNFDKNAPAEFLLQHYGISSELIPPVKNSSGNHGKLTAQAAEETGLAIGTPVTYRAGDQPNNAMSLNVLNPGEVAATGGTSGVIYGVADHPLYDNKSRVNPFAHVNHTKRKNRIGVLMCINGTGIQYAWLKNEFETAQLSYPKFETSFSHIPIGSDGVSVIPFGNGAERILEDKNIGAHIQGLHFNQHSKAHIYRASLEGIAHAFNYGADIMKKMGIEINTLKVGNDNLFQSAIFSNTIASLLDCEIEVIDTTGAVGAAKASGIHLGYYKNYSEATSKKKTVRKYRPDHKNINAYKDNYRKWKKQLDRLLKSK